MRKRILIGFCVTLLILLPVLSALSELDMDEGNCPTLAVFYVPAASKGTLEAIAANYTVRMIMARWNGKQNKYVQRTDSTAGTLQAADDAFKYENLFNKAGSEGNDTIKNFKAVKKALNKQDCDIWFVVPSKAVRNFISNSNLMEQLRELTKGTSSRIHIVFFSKEECDLDENTALGALTRDVAVECTTVLPDFQASKANGRAHNGSYFIASLFSKAPLDLPVSDEENTYSFTPNADGKAFVLICWNGASGDYAVKNASGQDVVQDSAFSIRPEKGEITYTGCMATGLEKGADYSVSLPEGAEASVRVYWYPDLDSIQPSLDPTDIQYGENTIQLSVADNLNQPDSFQIQFDFRKDDGEITNPSTALNENQMGWTARLNTSTSNATVTIVPRLCLKTADQNLVYEWVGNSVTQVLQSGTVELQPEAPEALTLYYYQDHMGQLRLSWDQFFAYNKSDESLQFNVESANDSGDSNGITVQHDKSGFTLKLNSSAVSEGSCDLVLTGKDKQHTLSVYRKDMAPLLNETITVEVSPTEPFSEESDSEEFTSDEDFSEKVHAGKAVEVTVTIPADTVAAWQEAAGQIEKGFPPLEDLVLEGKILSDDNDEEENGDETGQEDASTNHLEPNPLDGSRYGSVSLPTDANAEPGYKTVRASLHTGSGSFNLLLSNEPEFELINEPPRPAKESSEKEIRLEGLPWNYQTKDNLLELLFETDQPFDLFQDPEESLVKITLSIDNTDGLEMPDIETKEGDEAGEVSTEWKVDLTDSDSSIPIKVLTPGKHTITLTASDGIDRQEEPPTIIVQVEIYSIILRYASYAAAGLLAFLLILILIRIIVQARKPKFGNIQIRCYAGMDDDQERGREILSKCRPVPLKQYGKKPVTLSTVMVLTRQPALSAESSAIADDIQLLPTRHNELNLIFGKDARQKIGRHDKRQLITPGGHYRMRIGNTYIQLENYRG